jgi:hypothetical protein
MLGNKASLWSPVSVFVQLTLLGLVFLGPVGNACAKDEKHWQRVYCADMELEHVLNDGARVDCLSPNFAIEVDYVDHWAESIG